MSKVSVGVLRAGDDRIRVRQAGAELVEGVSSRHIRVVFGDVDAGKR